MKPFVSSPVSRVLLVAPSILTPLGRLLPNGCSRCWIKHIERDVSLEAGGPFDRRLRSSVDAPGLRVDVRRAQFDGADIHRVGDRDGVQIDRIISAAAAGRIIFLHRLGDGGEGQRLAVRNGMRRRARYADVRRADRERWRPPARITQPSLALARILPATAVTPGGSPSTPS